MTIKYLKKATKTASTDDTKTKEIVQNLLKELEKSKEEGCKELTKKFDKYDGEIIVSKEKIEDIKKKLDFLVTSHKKLTGSDLNYEIATSYIDLFKRIKNKKTLIC